MEPSTPRPGEAFCCCWSGGKDSCLALQRCVAAGGRAKALVSVFSEDGLRTRSHGLQRGVVEAQARALGLPLWSVSSSWSAYEERLVGLLRRLRAAGIGAVAFGDMDIEAHGAWELRVARAAGHVGHLPLWGERRRRALEEWWGQGGEARLVVVRDGVVPRRFLGRVLDASLAAELEALGVDACGENGEFHTVAVAGPLFSRRLELRLEGQVKREDCWVQDVVATDTCRGDPAERRGGPAEIAM